MTNRPMKVYVAGVFADYERVRRVMLTLSLQGATITHDWTADAERSNGNDRSAAVRQQDALNDLHGVAAADAVLVLTQEDKSTGCDLWVELGYALRVGVVVFIAGPQRNRSVFCELARQHETDEEAMRAMFDWWRDRMAAPAAPF